MNPTVADDFGKLIARLILGALILFHGLAKLTGGLGGIEGMVQGIGLPPILAYGVYLGEVVGPLLLIVGWHARIGAGLIVINMLFAFLLAHTGQLFQLNANTGGWQLELQGMFLFIAVALVLMGAGRLSVDGR